MEKIKKAWAEGRVVQYRDPTGEWVSWLNDRVLNLDASKEWREFPAAFVNLYGRVIPRPVDGCAGGLRDGQVYYIPHVKMGWQACGWTGSATDHKLLHSNMIHLSPIAAEHHAAAILDIHTGLKLD